MSENVKKIIPVSFISRRPFVFQDQVQELSFEPNDENSVIWKYKKGDKTFSVEFFSTSSTLHVYFKVNSIAWIWTVSNWNFFRARKKKNRLCKSIHRSIWKRLEMFNGKRNDFDTFFINDLYLLVSRPIKAKAILLRKIRRKFEDFNKKYLKAKPSVDQRQNEDNDDYGFAEHDLFEWDTSWVWIKSQKFFSIILVLLIYELPSLNQRNSCGAVRANDLDICDFFLLFWCQINKNKMFLIHFSSMSVTD